MRRATLKAGVDFLNVRARPMGEIVCKLGIGQTFRVLAEPLPVQANRKTWHPVLTDDQALGWVSADLIQFMER